jgi:hypothetical protein
MGLLDMVKSAFGVGKTKNMMTLRPTELDSWTRGSADIAKMPIIPFVGYRFVSEIYMYSDLLKTIIRSLVQETFRKGITIVPRFVVKCNICGSDYDAKVEKCEVCGSDSLRPPNYFEREYLEKWLNDVNFNDQSLIEVLQDVDTDLNIYDNAYLAVVKRYFYNDKGEVAGSEVVEVLRANPEYVMLVIDREGRPARTDDGKVAMFCLEHRDRYVTLLPEQVEDARCTVCGRKLYPAYYTVRKWSQGGTVCYTNGEILHIKKFTHGLGYGVSPIFSVWMKVLTLIKMDFFILTAYHLERPPKGVLVLRGQMESIQKAWHRLQEEARNNPHMIYPFVVEGADKAPRIAEWIDLSFSAKDIEFIQYREEIRRTVGALFGVMPVFQGDTGAGVGLANEGLQIVVTNRAVEREQTLFNEKVLPWLMRQMGVSDWEYQLIPNEGRDVVARIQRETMRIGNAERMAALGYKPVAVKTDDGIDFYYEVGGKEIAESERSGYIASKVYQEIPEREIPRYEGEPEHGRPRTDEQRFEGEELGRRPKGGDTFVVGEGGKLIPEGEVGKGFFLEKQKTVPEEYRRYISRDQLSNLPVGTRVHRGPRGGMFIDVREIPESVRERLDVEPASGDVASERVSGGKRYSGGSGDLKYEAVLDEYSGKARVSLIRGGYGIEFNVDINRGDVDVVSAKIPEVDMESVMKELELQERFVSPDAQSAFKILKDAIASVSVEKLKEYLKNRKTDMIGSDKSKTVVKGEELYIDRLIRYPRIRELANDNFYRVGDSKVFVHESIRDGQIMDRLQKFKEFINEDMVGAIVVVPTSRMFEYEPDGKSYSIGGFYSPDKDVIYLGDADFEYGLLHEYFHQVYAIFKRLRELNIAIHHIKGLYYHNLLEVFEKDGSLYNLKANDDKIKEALDIISGRFAHSLAIKARERYINTTKDDKLAELLRGLQKIIDSYGGEEGLEAFLEMVHEFDNDDGLTRYSRSYFEGRSYFTGKEEYLKHLVGTESFASVADFITSVIRLADEDEKVRELVSKYSRMPHKLLNEEIYNRILSSKYWRASGGFIVWGKDIDIKLKATSKFMRMARKVFKK